MMFDEKSKGIAQAYLKMLEAAKPKPAMDPVGNHDADIDNDGDKDKSDSYLIKRRAAISKSVKEEKCSTCGSATCKCSEGTSMKSAKKEALEIAPAGKSDVKKKGMVDKDGGDEEEDDSDDGSENKDDEIEITIKKKDDDKKKSKETMEKFDPLKHVKNPTPGEKKAAKDVKRSSYADRAAMLRSAQADGRLKKVRKEETEIEEAVETSKVPVGSRPKGIGWSLHRAGKQHNEPHDTYKRTTKQLANSSKNEETVWNWAEILEAPEEDIDALIESLDGDDLESFVTEFNAISEYTQSPPNVSTVKTGKEELGPRAPAEKAFVDAHAIVTKDHPFYKDQHGSTTKQSPTRPGEKRANEPMKTLKDIRK